ncbi:hypothetical protein [Saccharothrix carnea]|uniref:hypothetical protein n=1 Tax=Saccharothrix carnea TaxID=1280637 RepID=UPI0011B1DE07|nr:hypothetical protein [Saccharothrix carnea]
MEHVEVEFSVDEVTVHVAFDVDSGVPGGSVTQKASAGGTGRQVSLGTFGSDAGFESLMGALMLERLRLEPIAMWSNNQETSHAWPAYASALAVHADRLDPVVGNEGVLGTRMLQMFVGTSWAPARAQAATALSAVKFARERSRAKARAAAQAAEALIGAAEARVAAAQEVVASFDGAKPDVDAMLSLAAAATDRATEAQELSLRLFTARTSAAQVHDQLRAEQRRRNGAIEDALARRFFNAMTPTVCPRCSAAVTQDRRDAEGHHHECSLCSSPLDLDAFAVSVLVASDIPVGARGELVAATADAEAERTGITADVSGQDVEEYDGDVVDALVALQQAADDADAVVLGLEAEFAAAERNRLGAVAAAQVGRAQIERAHEQRKAELALARAEGALESLRQAVAPVEPQPVDDTRIEVLEAADRVTAAWLKSDQDPLLAEVSKEIAGLARRFGADNITAVSLKGNANMDVHKGGTKSGYGSLTNGEKLRLKLATAVALITQGHKAGVGRHPGLLFVDSPAAEEIPADDLETMINAMKEVAEETSMQIVVATRHSGLLASLLPDDNVLVATGDDFVW